MGLAFEKRAFDNPVNTSFVFSSPLGIANSFQRKCYILKARIKRVLEPFPHAASRKSLSVALTQPQKILKNILETDILVKDKLRAFLQKKENLTASFLLQ